MKHQQGELKDAISDLKSQLKQIQNILKNPTPAHSTIHNQRKY
jgi:hypothetical protein